MKKFISLLLIAALLLTMAVPAFAWPDDLSLEDLDDIFDLMADSSLELSEIAQAEKAAQAGMTLAQGFSTFLNVATKVGGVLSLVNGSVTFLKMIGVIEDPVQAGIITITNKLNLIDEKINAMDTKINGIVSSMSRLEALTEFNGRTQRAEALMKSWSNFDQTYMENGLDKLITELSAMSLNGMHRWCENKGDGRTYGEVDNTSLVLRYLENEDDYALTYTDENGLPSDYEKGERYVVLGADFLPQYIRWDANRFRAALVRSIADAVYAALAAGNYDAFASDAFPLFSDPTALSREAVDAFAEDAADLLAYRTTCAQLNTDAHFALSVVDAFTNYCRRLTEAKNGIDAVINSLYLTHAFEFETKEDLLGICDRMIVKTGVYGMFAANVMGMSHDILDAQKLDAMKLLYSTTQALDSAKSSCLTGNDRFSYLTNSELRYTDMSFESEIRVTTEEPGYLSTYKSTKSSGISPNFHDHVLPDAKPIGDKNFMLLLYTLQSNGVTDVHTYLHDKVSETGANPYGRIVTSFAAPEVLPLDKSVKLHSEPCIGDYFPGKDGLVLDPLPDSDIEEKYFTSRTRVLGSVYDLTTGELSTSVTLHAAASYGETHTLWIEDEAAILCGPSDYANFRYETSHTHMKSQHSYTVRSTSAFDTVLSIPVVSGELGAPAQSYNALDSYSALCEELNAQLGDEPAPAEITPVPETAQSSDNKADADALAVCLAILDACAARDGLEAPLADGEKTALAEAMLTLCESFPVVHTDMVKGLDGGYYCARLDLQPDVHFTKTDGVWSNELRPLYTARYYRLIADANGQVSQEIDAGELKSVGVEFTFTLPCEDKNGDGSVFVTVYDDPFSLTTVKSSSYKVQNGSVSVKSAPSGMTYHIYDGATIGAKPLSSTLDTSSMISESESHSGSVTVVVVLAAAVILAVAVILLLRKKKSTDE